MAQLVVRGIEDEVKERLRQRAEASGHSLEAEVRDLLRDAAKGPVLPRAPLGSRIAARFAGHGLQDDLPELHGQAVRPADLKP